MLVAKGAELESERSADALWSGVVSTLASVGLPHVIWITADADRSHVLLKTTMPDLYEGIDPGDDPFLFHCCDSYEITRTGVDYLPEHAYLGAEEAGFIKKASDLGWRTGFGIPTRLEHQTRFGGFNIGSPLDRDGFEAAFDGRQDELRVFCLIVHRRLEELIPPPSSLLDRLSPREREVMAIVATGATRKETARQLGLSPNTVAEYTKSIYRKLGVRNRIEAARLLE